MEDQFKIRGVNVVYGTETGTAYDLAKQFMLVNQQNLKINRFCNISDIQEFQSLKQQQDTLWIFFISTTGQGDFPYSMRSLWKKMMTKSYPSLKWMKFTIFSLGDRSYGDNFCMAARKFRQRLISLQAEEAVEIGLGDQQQPNGYFYEYKEKWCPNLITYCNSEKIFTHLQEPQFPMKVNQVQTKKQSEINFNHENKNSTGIISSIVKNQANLGSRFGLKPQQFQLRIKKRQQVCVNKDRRVFTIDLELINYPQKIQLGDILSIYPDNSPQDVAYLIKYFNVHPDDVYLSKTSSPLTYRQLLTSYLNVSSTLNHSFFISRSDLPDLKSYCSEGLFKSKLQELAQSYDEYHNYIKKYKRNVVQLIKDFDLQGIPFEEFIERCGDIVSRKYSIAQVFENEQNNRTVRILFKLAKKNINENRVYHGICSHDLGLWAEVPSMKRGSILKGEFEYKEKTINNLVFITLGTGIAPFMQFFSEASKSKNQWSILLFYTNRYQNENYFQTLLEELVSQGKVHPFISFTGEGGKRILRLVEDNCEKIRNMIEKVGLEQMKIMVCGPKEVCEGMENILGRELAVDMKVLKKKKIFMYQNW